MIHILTILVLCWFAGSVVADGAVQWYEVEIIAFKYTAPDSSAEERWPADAGKPALQDAILLRPPQRLSFNKGPDGLPVLSDLDPAIAQRLVPLPVTKPAPSASAAPGTTASTPVKPGVARVQVYPEPFERIDDESLQMTGVARALRKSTAYAPLLHVGWRQPGNSKGDTVYISAGPNDGKTLEGTVNLNLSRYLHLALDLVFRPSGAPGTLPVAMPEPDGALQKTPSVAYRLTESRRMRSQELHYFDHPKFGVIALITPYEPQVLEMSVPAAPTSPAAGAMSPAGTAPPQTSPPPAGATR